MSVKFTTEQVNEVMEKRGTSRKMAVQWLTRQAKAAAKLQADVKAPEAVAVAKEATKAAKERENPHKVAKDVDFNGQRILSLYASDKSVSEIAIAIGYPKGHGNNRVANFLVKAGVYKGTRA